MDRTLFNISILESLVQFEGSSTDRILKAEEVFTQICRTCLCETSEKNQGNDIFLPNDTNETSISLKGMVETSIGLRINSEDKLPHNICDDCMKAVEAAYDFRTQSQRIDEILKRVVKQIYRIRDEATTESVSIPMISAKIDKPTEAIEIEGFQVSYVEEETANYSFQCHPCNMNFQSKVNLDKHKSEHGPPANKSKLFKCETCSKEYSFRNGLHNHLMTAHEQNKELECPICGRKFKKRDRLMQHRKTFCIAPDSIRKKATVPTQITVCAAGDSMNPGPLPIEIRNFSCTLCDGTFELEIDFINHMPIHSTEKRCPYCKKFFSRAFILESHIRSHTGEKPFVCPLCLKGFTATRSLRNHLKSHAKKETYMCGTCGNNYISERELLRHLKIHDEEPKFVDFDGNNSEDANTNKGNMSKEELDITLDLSSVKAIDLPLASSSANEWVDADQKYKKEHGDMRTKSSTSTTVSFDTFSSSGCKIEPGTEMNINTNKETTCLKEENIEVHCVLDATQVQSVPNQTICSELPVGCDITIKQELSDDGNTAFELTNELLSDEEPSLDQPTEDLMKMSASATYGRFTCAVAECKVEFKYYRDIINHYTSQHCVGPPPFACPVCAKLFPVKLEVRNHLKSHLTCEYKCTYCPRAYWQMRDLKIHLRTHTGERPFKCPNCPKRFKQRPALKVHIKTHNICKEYKCNICSKEFFSYNGMFLHRKGHTEIKELQCNICGKQLPTKSRLRRHQEGICGNRRSERT